MGGAGGQRAPGRGSRPDNLRLYLASGGEEAAFSRAWAAVEAWVEAMQRGIRDGTYHAARGFVMYVCSGRKPNAEAR